ncbi:MAG: hypothetical protein EBS93_07035 [Chitinophagia bacterium]|nr:hypothetical protein [Chitinophagia bacterium]NCA30453.1 hypothetical protein [Chitinophagia bacterium]
MTKKYSIEFLESEGGSTQFYSIVGYKKIGFKEFANKRLAQKSYSIQKKLAKLGLAPKVYGNLRKLPFKGTPYKSNWGYVTQIVKVGMKVSRKKIQHLVEQIYEKTKLKFWDCHEYNIGKIGSGKDYKLVIIDTGPESFTRNVNAWGNENPGPKCSECDKLKCKCDWGFLDAIY